MVVRNFVPDGKSVRGVGLIPERNKSLYRESIPYVQSLLASDQIDPIIGAQLPLHEAAEAHRQLESRAVTGKIVLIPANGADKVAHQ